MRSNRRRVGDSSPIDDRSTSSGQLEMDRRAGFSSSDASIKYAEGKPSGAAGESKKLDDAFVAVAEDWPAETDKKTGDGRPPFNRNGGSGGVGDPTRGLVSISAGGQGHAVVMTLVNEADRLGKPRSVLLMLSVVLLITGVFCTFSAPTVFYSNHQYKVWAASYNALAKSKDLPTSPAIPAQFLFLEHALWRFGVPAIAIGLGGAAIARTTKGPGLLYLQFVLAVILAAASFGVVIMASTQSYSKSGETEWTQALSSMWDSLQKLPSDTGVEALCNLQVNFQCSGFTSCCLTNTTVVDTVPWPSRSDSYWDSVCFITVPNGTMINNEGHDVTDTILKQCGHMLKDTRNSAGSQAHSSMASHSSPTSNSSSRGPSSSSSSAHSRRTRDTAHELESPIDFSLRRDTPPVCPPETLLTKVTESEAAIPCQRRLTGSLTTSLAFSLCALFTMATVAAVSAGFAFYATMGAGKKGNLMDGCREADAVTAAERLPTSERGLPRGREGELTGEVEVTPWDERA